MAAAGAGTAVSLRGPQRAALPARRSLLKRIMPAGLALLGVIVLTGLGIWQLERRVWKLDLIEKVEQRVHAAPVAAPGPSSWSHLDAYRRVDVRGRFLSAPQTLVRAVTERGAGYWVIVPFRAQEGFTVLVNRGFIPADAAAQDLPNASGGEVVLTGLLRLTEPGGGFLRHNDPANERWYSRDVDAIAAARGIGSAAPYFIDVDASGDPSALPVGGLTVIAFANNHLVYALTWFGLAAMLAGWLAVFVRQELRLGKPGGIR